MLTDEQELELKKQLAATAKENAVNAVFARTGIKMSKPVRAYIESVLSCEVREGNSPVITATEPTTGRAYASLDAFIEAVKTDPDFAPASTQSTSGNSVQPQEIPVGDLAAHLDKRNARLEDIASGNVRVVFPEPQNRELGTDEVSAYSQSQLNSSIDKIARGEKRVVFPGRG